MNNDVIVKLTMDFFEEAKKNPYKNIQRVVSDHYNLWYQDGGLADVLEYAGLGVYRVISAILQKAGYENATEDYVGRCIRKHEARHGLKSPKIEPVPAAGVITRKLDTSPVDRGVVVPGGSPSGGNLTSAEVSPVRVIEEKFPVATSSNSSSSVSGWWDGVAQKLGIEIKEVSPDFNFKEVFVKVNIQNMHYEDMNTPYPEYTDKELELIGGILYFCREHNTIEKSALTVGKYFYKTDSDAATKAMIKKCDKLRTIIRFS